MTQAPTPGPLSGEAMRDMVWSWLREPDAARIAIRFNWGDATSLGAFLSERLAPTAPVETLGEMAAFWGNVVTGAGGAETLHPATADLVDRFAAELKSKLAKAEAKYGYLDDWSKPDWKDDLIESLAEHVQKGDPRDVAAYCAFAWHHGWSTSEVPDCFHRAPRHTDVVQALEPFAKAARMAGINSHNKPNLEQEAKRAVSWLDFSRAAKAIELSATQPNTAPVEASGSERGQAGAVMDALWPLLGGNHTSAELWTEIDAAVSEALRPQPSGETREAVARIVEALEGSKDRGDSSVILSQSDLRALLSARPAPVASGGQHSSGEAFQPRVHQWLLDCFGWEIAGDRQERGDRLLEEVLELLQSGGYDPARVAALRDYVWGRPVGEPAQEVGGVMVTLAAYCVAHDLDMMGAGQTELARIVQPEIVKKIRAKQAAKPTGSALPIAVPAQDDDKLRIAVEEALADVEYVPGDHPIVPVKHDRFVKAIRHALKSTAAQEGGSK